MKCFKLVAIGDLHLGQRRINCENSINSLKATLTPLLPEIDILFFPGDFFDNLNTLDSRVSLAAIKFMQELYYKAKENNFLIRVVRGTFLHDRNQNDFWSVFTDDEGTVKVFNSITFETVRDLDIIYIPDGSPRDSMSIIRSLLQDRDKSQVDLVVGHGEFEHTLEQGETPHDTIFKASDFDTLVKGCVIFGHRHTHSVYKKVVYTGSWERFRHGEESPKGFVSIDYDKESSKVKIKHHLNSYTSTYKSVPFYESYTPENAVKKLHKIVNELEGLNSGVSYLQIKTDDLETRNLLRDTVKNLYPNIVLSFPKLNSEKAVISNTNLTDLVLITDDNLSSLIVERIKGKLTQEEVQSIIDSL